MPVTAAQLSTYIRLFFNECGHKLKQPMDILKLLLHKKQFPPESKQMNQSSYIINILSSEGVLVGNVVGKGAT